MIWCSGGGATHVLSLKSGGANINLSNNDMASGCWIIRLQEEDHLEQSLHKVDDLDQLLQDAGLSDFRKGMIWMTHFTNWRNCFAVMDH